MSEEEKYDRIEDYLNGTLGADERRSFEALLDHDESLRAEVQLHRKLQQTFANTEVKELEQKIGAILRKKQQGRTRALWIYAAAASILLLVTTFLFWPQPKPSPDTLLWPMLTCQRI